MAIVTRAIKYGQRRLVRKMVRAVPYLGGIVAVLTVGSAMRRKGAVKGAVDTALDFIPWIGGAKNVAEALRGRDFFPDRSTIGAQPGRDVSVTA